MTTTLNEAETQRPIPERAEATWPPVVVAGAYQTGVVLMRNLKRRGLTVYACDSNALQPGFQTVYGRTYLCPNPDDEPQAWLSFMIDLARQIGTTPVLIASADQFVTAISEHVDELKKYFIFSQSSTSVHGLLATKKRQYDIAGSHGLPTSRTKFVQTAEQLVDFANVARFPCLIKPLHCRDWERLPEGHPLRNGKLVVTKTPAELCEQYETIAELTPEVIVQEVIEGPDNAKLVYMGCYGRSGRRLGSCIVRQIRTSPIYFGSASVVEPVEDPEADRLSDEFLRNVGYVGICELELKRDSRDGQVKLIEANPRYSVTADAAPYAGVDIGWLHYLDLIGVDVQAVRPSSADYRHIVLHRDFATFRSYLHEGLAGWRDILRSYRPPVYFFDFDWKDWRVTSKNAVELAKILLYPYVRRFLPKRRSS